MLSSAVKSMAKKVAVTAALVIGERVARKILDKVAEKRGKPSPAPGESGK